MSDSAGVSPEFVQDLAQRVAKLRDLSEAGGFVLPAEITTSLAKLRTSVLERQLGHTPPASSLSFNSEQYSDADEKAEARRVKEAREEELRRMKEQSARLRASVHSRMSDFKSECDQYVERSMRTSFEVTSYRQELQRLQATDQRPPTPESSLLGASDRVKEMQREVNALKDTLQARQQVGRENEQLRELIKQMELAVERQKGEKAECKLHCALL